MKLTQNGRKRQTAIAKALKKGVPLAGLLSSLLMTTGCDLFRAAFPHQTMGDVPMPEPSQITPAEQSEEHNNQLPADQQPETPAKQENNQSATNLGTKITTGTPQLPIITDVSDELKETLKKHYIDTNSRPVGGDF